MFDLRKLAALDIVSLGYKLILAEYAFAVVFSTALGIFVLARSHSGWQIALGIYLVCLGINYIPMLVWTIAFRNRQNARAEVADALANKNKSFASFRRQSLALLIPLVPVAFWVFRFIPPSPTPNRNR